jgi:hypothetical protein
MNSSDTVPSSSSLPWYRYFLPWMVIALVSSAVIGSLVSAYLAAHTRDVVLDHPDASQ